MRCGNENQKHSRAFTQPTRRTLRWMPTAEVGGRNGWPERVKETKKTLGRLYLHCKKVNLEVAFSEKEIKKVLCLNRGKNSEDQGRIIQDIDDDPLVSLVRESMKEKLADFVTPKKASGEAQEE
ncbi:hypothetical protein Tco_1243193 [Tanacetum coccineum]